MFLHRFKYKVLDYIYKMHVLVAQKDSLTCLRWKIEVIQSLWQDTRMKKPYNIPLNKYLQDKILLSKQNVHALRGLDLFASLKIRDRVRSPLFIYNC